MPIHCLRALTRIVPVLAGLLLNSCLVWPGDFQNGPSCLSVTYLLLIRSGLLAINPANLDEASDQDSHLPIRRACGRLQCIAFDGPT